MANPLSRTRVPSRVPPRIPSDGKAAVADAPVEIDGIPVVNELLLGLPPVERDVIFPRLIFAADAHLRRAARAGRNDQVRILHE
jgi:hypothetical protein